MINAAEPSECCAPLDLQANPFGANANPPPPVASTRTALKEAISHIGIRSGAIVIAGGPGTGKTFLLNMIVRSCSDLGLSVCRFDRGDLADTTIDARSDVAVVDDADSIPDSVVLTLLFPNPGNTPATWVFACLPASVHRFSCLDAGVVELRGLSADDARTYLLERATSIGRPDLFAADALDLIIHRACGSPRVLLSIASLAFFTAAWGRATQIGVRHVAYWLKSQAASGVVEHDAAPHRAVLRGESANHAKAKRSSGGRARPLTAAAATIAASIAIAAFLAGGNDARMGTDKTVPVAPNLVAADVSPVPAPPATPVSPDIPSSVAQDAAAPAPVDAPAERANATSGRRDRGHVERPRAAPKRAGPPAPTKTARSARAPKRTGPPAALEKAALQARDAVHVARHAQDAARRAAEESLQAQHAARQASDAARRAGQAARRADRAASQAERAARQANWGIRLQSSWKAMTAPRSAS